MAQKFAEYTHESPRAILWSSVIPSVTPLSMETSSSRSGSPACHGFRKFGSK